MIMWAGQEMMLLTSWRHGTEPIWLNVKPQDSNPPHGTQTHRTLKHSTGFKPTTPYKVQYFCEKWVCKLKEYYEIVGESRPLSAFFLKHADYFTEMHL